MIGLLHELMFKSLYMRLLRYISCIVFSLRMLNDLYIVEGLNMTLCQFGHCLYLGT